MPKQQQKQRGKPRKKDPNALKKPNNPFILYKMDNNPQFIKDYNEYLDAHKDSSSSKQIHQQSLINASRLLGARWRNESAEVKQKYREASNKLIVAHHQELKARNAQALLEQQKRKEEARAIGGETHGALEWQNHTPLPHGAPPFVEGGSSQAGFMPQAFQGHTTVPILGQILVGGTSWNLTPGPIRNQRALPAFPVGTRFFPYARPAYRAPHSGPLSEQTVLPGSQNTMGNMIAPSGFMPIPEGLLNHPIQRRNVGGQNANSSAEAFLSPGVQLNQRASQRLPALDEMNSQIFGHTTAELNNPQHLINAQNAQVIGQPNQLHQPTSIGEQNGRISAQTFDARALSGRAAGSSSALPFNSSVVLPTSFQTSPDFPPLQNDFAPGFSAQARWNDLGALTLNEINGSMDQNFVDDQHPFRTASPNFDRILPQTFDSPRNNSASVSPQDVHRTVPRALGSFDYYGQYL